MGNELVKVIQLPVIEEQLKEVSKQIDKKVDTLNKLLVTEDTVKEVKKVRADFRAELMDWERKRKEVKEKVLAPYLQFEEVYKLHITDKYKDADEQLKVKIDNVENEIKKQKEDEVRDYFEEYLKSKNIDFIKFEDVEINITLSASLKSLKDKAKEFIDKIESDLKLIETQEKKTEILVEYKKDLNVSRAIQEVTERYKKIEEEKVRQEELARKKEEEQKRIEEVENIAKEKQGEEYFEAPVMEKNKETEKIILTFKVQATKEKLIELKRFLDEGEYDYE